MKKLFIIALVALGVSACSSGVTAPDEELAKTLSQTLDKNMAEIKARIDKDVASKGGRQNLTKEDLKDIENALCGGILDTSDQVGFDLEAYLDADSFKEMLELSDNRQGVVQMVAGFIQSGKTMYDVAPDADRCKYLAKAYDIIFNAMASKIVTPEIEKKIAANMKVFGKNQGPRNDALKSIGKKNVTKKQLKEFADGTCTALIKVYTDSGFNYKAYIGLDYDAIQKQSGGDDLTVGYLRDSGDIVRNLERFGSPICQQMISLNDVLNKPMQDMVNKALNGGNVTIMDTMRAMQGR